MQFCSSRETKDVTKVPKLTIWQTSPSFNTDWQVYPANVYVKVAINSKQLAILDEISQ